MLLRRQTSSSHKGVDTPGVLLARGRGARRQPIGHVWIGPQPRPGFVGAWIYSIEIDPGTSAAKGYGRALLSAAEEEAARRGFKVIGLNVFGPNAVARKLYESAGYEVSSLQMHKELSGIP